MSVWLSFAFVATLVCACLHGVYQLVRRPPGPRGPSVPAEIDRVAPRAPRSRARTVAVLLVNCALLVNMRPEIGWQPPETAFWSDGGLPALEGALHAEIVGWAQQNPVSGVAVGIVTPAGVARATFGRSSLRPGAAPLHEATFEIGSITKTFTGMLLARLVDEGVVRLDQRLADSLPPGIELSADMQSITLEQLATHTAGLPRLPPGMMSAGSFARILFGLDPYRVYLLEDLTDALSTTRLDAPPGDRFAYSNYGFGVLGWLLGRAAGAGYVDAVRDLVIDPLGIEDIDSRSSAARAAPAAGYSGRVGIGPLWFALRRQPWEMTEAFAGAGGLWSTLDGMLAYLEANMRHESTPLAAAARLAHRQRFREGPERGVGLAWIRSRRDDIGRTVIWHNGQTGGFASFLGFTDDRRAGVVVLSNTSRPVDPLADALLTAIARQDGQV